VGEVNRLPPELLSFAYIFAAAVARDRAGIENRLAILANGDQPPPVIVGAAARPERAAALSSTL